MKNFCHFFKTDLQRVFTSYRWIVGIIGVAAALFFSLESHGFYDENVVSTYVFSTWMSGSLIVYIFCAFSYATVFSEELEHKYIRYGVIRGGVKKYIISKTLVIYLSSIVVMLGGTLLFLLICRKWIPWGDMSHSSDFETLVACSYGEILQAGHPLKFCMLYALNLGLLSGMLSLFSAFCSILISNKIFVLITPVVLFRILASVNVFGYNIYIFYALKIFENDLFNLLFLFLLSVVPSIIISIGIYKNLNKRL